MLLWEQFEPRLNLLNMRNSMQAKPGLVLTVVSSQRVMTKELCTSIIGHSMSTGTSINVPLMGAVLMGILFGMMNSTWYGGICRRIMGCTSPWGALSVMAHFVPNKHNKNRLPHVQGRRPNLAPMVKKKYMCIKKCTTKKFTTEAALKNHKKVHKGTDKKYVCSLCGKALGSTTALHRHEKIHQDQ